MWLLAWLSVALAAAQSSSATPIAVSVGSKSNRTVSPTTFASLEELARLVDISYCVGSTGIQKPFRCLSRCSDFEEGAIELVTTWNTGPLLSDSSGYIAVSHEPLQKRVIVAFRGTYSIANALADLAVAPAEYEPFDDEQRLQENENDLLVCASASDRRGKNQEKEKETAPPLLHTQPQKRSGKCSNCTVHSGFLSSWRNARCTVVPHIEKALEENPGYELTLVGHSLGGAVAVLAALEFQARGWAPHVTTFGEPRVGNKAFNDFVNERFNSRDDDDDSDNKDGLVYRRVTHANDPVPLLPPEEWGYTMHASEIYISKKGLPPEVQDLQYCSGNSDPQCIAATTPPPPPPPPPPPTSQSLSSFPFTLHDNTKLDGAMSEDNRPQLNAIYTIPGLSQRFRLWELLFAHRDYFWRLGLCVPGGDPWHWSRDQYDDGTGEYDELL